MITRFAPSPTGYLHLGHAFSALTSWQVAQKGNGEFILRIEDIDKERCKTDYEEAIYEDLDWLGISWLLPVRRQQDHFSDYAAALDQLRDKGLAYRCFHTRKQIAAAAARAPQENDPPSPPSIPKCHPDEEQALLAQGKPYSWRFDMTAAKALMGRKFSTLSFEEKGSGPHEERGKIIKSPENIGDTIIGRKDNGTSYHIACVVDDALQGITDIVRGNDLFEITPFHVLLQQLLKVTTPHYHHHAILRDETGTRFSKRQKSVTLRSLRKQGKTPDEIRYLCGFKD